MSISRTFLICLCTLPLIAPSAQAETLNVNFMFEFLDCSKFPAEECTVIGTSPRSFTVDTTVAPIKEEFDTDGVATHAQFERAIESVHS